MNAVAMAAIILSFRLLFTAIALHSSLFWLYGSSQEPGFLSVDCGSDSASTYKDSYGIEWISDSNLISEGTPKLLSGTNDSLLSTMRLFDGNQSKYCYSLTNSAVKAGAFFLVRASFWAGMTPPYTPRNPDNNFQFKMIVDATEWIDIKVPFGQTDSQTSDVYMRAQRSSIDVCLARITPSGDAPFISALELRPLPSTLSTTKIMDLSNLIFIAQSRQDYGIHQTGPPITRYPDDSLDRIWISFMPTGATDMSTDASIDVSRDIDEPPSRILQDGAFSKDNKLTLTWNGLEVEAELHVVFHFAELNTNVNASGQSRINIFANGNPFNTEGPIDVFAQVGAHAAYSFGAAVLATQAGDITVDFVSPDNSTTYALVCAGELFSKRASNSVTSANIVSVVEDIKTSLGLSSHTGDPCLPIGYGYSWLNCSVNGAGITTISLSGYGTGHEIPKAINQLTNLIELHLDGNSLEGQIPDLSALVNADILDLSNNKLTGSIPSFLATLPRLKALYLQDNNLSGEIPAALLQRKRASLLTFEFSGNPVLCESNSGECQSSDSKKSNIGMIVGVIAGILVVVAISIAVYCYCRKRQPRTGYQRSSSVQRQMDGSAAIDIPIIKLSIQEFSFEEIKNATKNFQTKLGEGGFGPVYKGCLENGRVVAIKVASNFSHQGLKEFLNEVDLLSRVRHKNLVGLVGFCKTEKLVLVYEFMSNGSLFDCLHGPHAKASPLSWAARLRIITDAAQGLDYLHDGCKPPIIHRDVKSSNILLDDQMEAKISDFGISRDYINNVTGAPPTTLMGSMGYMDPEYFSNMRLTEKVDVYGFGVLLFEVVCGRRAVCKDASQQQTSVVEWAKASIDRGMIDDIVDESLHGEYDAPSVWKVVEVALACVEMPSFKRPKMSDVHQELKEAKRVESESHENNSIDKPSIEFTSGSGSTLSYTHVSAR